MGKKTEVTPALRLALDRYLLGLWTEQEMTAAIPAHPALAPLAALGPLDRPAAAQKLREEWLGRARPSDEEELEALLREGVDRASAGKTMLPELQHDLLANASAVPRDDPRAEAVRILAGLAAATQVDIAVQAVGHIAETTTDRVPKARAEALARLSRVLKALPHLAP
jgi:hypothetical protein